MKMKKILLLILLFLFIPIVVDAKTCDVEKVSIESISLDDNSFGASEIDPASFDGRNIILNLGLSEVGDNLRYKLIVKNDSNDDFELDDLGITDVSDYFNYSFEFEDGTNTIGSGETKIVYFNVSYLNEIPSDTFENGEFYSNDVVTISLSSSDIISVPDTLKNRSLVVIVIVVAFVIIGTLLLVKDKKVKAILLMIEVIAIPVGVNAMCRCDLTIESKIKVVYTDTNPCTFDGQLEQGATYINGDYTYKYMQAKNEDGWHNVDTQGWGVALTYTNTERPITSEICTSINGKKITSEYDMERRNPSEIDYLTTNFFFFSNGNVSLTKESFESLEIVPNLDIPENAIKSWDVSASRNGSVKAWYLDEDNDSMYELYIGGNGGVTANPDSSYIFYGFSNISTIKNLTSLDVSSVTNMNGMFGNLGKNVTDRDIVLDVTGWDTSKVTDMSIAFTSMGGNNISHKFEIIGLDDWDTSNVTTMSSMFSGTGIDASIWSIGNLSKWDTRKVTSMKSMFAEAGGNAQMASFGSLDVYNANMGSGSIGYGMFYECTGCNGTLNIKGTPTSYKGCFYSAANRDNAEIIVNYSSVTTNIDQIIATKRNDANITKGRLLD